MTLERERGEGKFGVDKYLSSTLFYLVEVLNAFSVILLVPSHGSASSTCVTVQKPHRFISVGLLYFLEPIRYGVPDGDRTRTEQLVKLLMLPLQHRHPRANNG